VFIKICGITDTEDALVAAGLGANAVGMIFAASPRRVTSGVASEIVRRLPPEVAAIGVFLDESPHRVLEIANTVGLSAVQIHGSGGPDEARWLGERIPVLIRAFSVADPALKRASDYGATRLLVDSATPGSGKSFDWTILDGAPFGRDFILAGGLTPDNVRDAIRTARPWGVDVASGVESAPGRKDATKMRRFISAARQQGGELQGGLDTLKFGPMAIEVETGSETPKPFNWEEDHIWP